MEKEELYNYHVEMLEGLLIDCCHHLSTSHPELARNRIFLRFEKKEDIFQGEGEITYRIRMHHIPRQGAGVSPKTLVSYNFRIEPQIAPAVVQQREALLQFHRHLFMFSAFYKDSNDLTDIDGNKIQSIKEFIENIKELNRAEDKSNKK